MHGLLRLIWPKSITLLALTATTVIVGTPTVAALGAFSAAIAQNGTLTAGSIVLRENASSDNCFSNAISAPFTTNSSTCSTIDTFGAPTGQLPGGTPAAQTLTFTNVGSSSASSFSVTAGACSVSGAGTYYGNDPGTAFCSDVDVTIGNLAGTVCFYPSQPTACPALSHSYTLTALNTASPLTIGSGLAAGASDVLVVSTRLDQDASNVDMGLQATQPFTWTLNR